MNSVSNNNFGVLEGSMPYVIREGVFGATIHVNNEPLYLRMELITEENTKNWTRFKTMSYNMANGDSRGVLSGLVSTAGKDEQFQYEDVKKFIGYTSEEYNELLERAIKLKEKTNDKIVGLLNANSVGTNHMNTYFYPGRRNYIVYASKNYDFSIQDQSDDLTGKGFNLKNYIDSYSDILISVGSDFSNEDSFHNRGISRNPYWVFEEKYAGLSMFLHGFIGAVAAMFFPEKEWMHVKPVGSMQLIIKKNLLPGEGYIERNGEKIDITSIDVKANDPEGDLNYIKTSALARIFFEKVGAAVGSL